MMEAAPCWALRWAAELPMSVLQHCPCSAPHAGGEGAMHSPADTSRGQQLCRAGDIYQYFSKSGLATRLLPYAASAGRARGPLVWPGSWQGAQQGQQGTQHEWRGTCLHHPGQPEFTVMPRSWSSGLADSFWVAAFSMALVRQSGGTGGLPLVGWHVVRSGHQAQQQLHVHVTTLLQHWPGAGSGFHLDTSRQGGAHRWAPSGCACRGPPHQRACC